ncbi:hypothetical protein ACLF3G_24050 [Falsiroseomonas sp. HC035]|uniref:hypothetical protein n=1 Tax=Falsiroseomonas sp. HC035 TaxID=3390999 RepID=UPI003D314D38
MANASLRVRGKPSALRANHPASGGIAARDWLGGLFSENAVRPGYAREDIAGDVLPSGTTMQLNSPAKGWNAGAVMADVSLNRRQTSRVGVGVAIAQAGVVGSDGQIELEALRLRVYGIGQMPSQPARPTPLVTPRQTR